MALGVPCKKPDKGDKGHSSHEYCSSLVFLYLVISLTFCKAIIINIGLFFAIVEVLSILLGPYSPSHLDCHWDFTISIYCQPRFVSLTSIRARFSFPHTHFLPFGLFGCNFIVKVVGGSLVRMVVFNGSNWATWKPRMEDFLCCKDLEGPLLGDSTKPEKISMDEWKILDRKTVGYICQWICDNVYHKVSQEKSAYFLWKKLEKLYETKNVNNKAFLMKKLVNLTYVNGNPVVDHLNEFQNISNQLASMNLCLDEELQALFLISSFHENWETLVVFFSNSTPNGVVSMEQVSASPLNEEMTRRNSRTRNGESQALVLKNRGTRNQETKVMQTRVGASEGQGRIFFAIIVMRRALQESVQTAQKEQEEKSSRRCH